ncbi:MAG: MerR family transcriptional regulator [Bacteroidetes bacterium RIFCSPLOWO2_12_FULL_35_15]|nr:MAG: MerR family transcriptional regulator [Bacteroidetes bacterium RIFCSPLOWO2_12_FULL_35_15]
MQIENLISVDVFCTNHNIEISFVRSLQKMGMIEIATIKETEFIEVNQLQQLEKIIRFHYELDINLEGIETITHLLQKVNSMQNEISALKNKLRLYDENE